MSYELTARMHQMNGASAFHLELFGNYLAEREGYRQHRGFDAIRFFLMGKHNWLVRDVRSMSIEDLEFALAEEMAGWVVPTDARDVYPLPELTFG